MKTLNSALTLFLAVLFVAVAGAQNALTGKWEGTTPNGTPIQFDLTATETVVKGTVTRDGMPFPIEDGKVTKNAFGFKVTMNEQTEALSGEVAGDQITVWLDRQGREMAIVLKRVKK